MSTSAARGWTSSAIESASTPALAMTTSDTAKRGIMTALSGMSGTIETIGNESGAEIGIGIGNGTGRGTLTHRRGADAAATPWKRAPAGEICLYLTPDSFGLLSNPIFSSRSWANVIVAFANRAVRQVPMGTRKGQG